GTSCGCRCPAAGRAHAIGTACNAITASNASTPKRRRGKFTWVLRTGPTRPTAPATGTPPMLIGQPIRPPCHWSCMPRIQQRRAGSAPPPGDLLRHGLLRRALALLMGLHDFLDFLGGKAHALGPE